MYTASVPLFKQTLNSLSAILNKAEAHALANKIDPEALLQARLFPDMFPLYRQVVIATEFAKGCASRIAGIEVVKYEGNDMGFAGLQARIAATLAVVQSVTPEQINGSEDRDIRYNIGTITKEYKGLPYLLHAVLPQFYFHVTTAYAILRHNGVPVGKTDYLGTY